MSVVKGGIDDYFAKHPTTAALAIEIAISTEALDRKKALIYAESGFQEYWLFLPLRRQLVVHRQLSEGRYQSVETLGADTIAYVEADMLGELTVRLPGHIRLKAGETLRLAPQDEYLHFFDQNGQRMEVSR